MVHRSRSLADRLRGPARTRVSLSPCTPGVRPRHPVNQSGELDFPGKGRLRVKVQDIAENGAGVVSEISIPVGARGELVLNLLTPKPVRFVAGFVVTDVSLAGMSGYRIGLDFDALPEEMAQALHAFVLSRKVNQLTRPD